MTARLNDWLTIAEACAYLKVTRATVYRWIRDGRLKSYRLGERGTRLRRADVEAMLSPKDNHGRVTVVGLSKSETYLIEPGMRVLGDALSKFTDVPASHVVFLNQEPCDRPEVELSAGDVLVILPKTIEAGLHGASDDADEKQALLKLAESSFAKDWDNEQDAIYNNWQELYGIHAR
jgi:excisionase family DNA binding protein